MKKYLLPITDMYKNKTTIDTIDSKTKSYVSTKEIHIQKYIVFSKWRYHIKQLQFTYIKVTIKSRLISQFENRMCISSRIEVF